ncbi:LacI family DNA-binding transcriptional regulator [Inquilinus limosus]|uniref:LacI family transcriptional regulator n=1 Tax=Inquilinus limosus MP06 TaxID=1398085 RepID=A0A0A0DAI6_9PROT|nr:LacI family DNA-binding transcriptional regulator [Inquilinus limosus]KGM33982.1 LacI family transcriptional regulator [Inquilinus limosus MP06]
MDQPPKSIPTIEQVARAAGVARSTVSRAFSRPGMLSAETVAHIMEVAARLGYAPNQVARALSTGRYGNIALIVPDVANPFFPPLIRAAEARADAAGLCVFLGDSDEDPDREERLTGKMAAQVDGFVLASSRLGEDAVRSLRGRRPVVLVNRDIDGLDRVLIDSAPGTAAAVRHLQELGHRRIAYVGGPPFSWSNQQRRTAVLRTAGELAVEAVEVAADRPSYEDGMAAAPAVLSARTTAAIAFDDLVAQGLMAGLAELGIDVPAGFSVIGCDDVLGARTYPPLTTISARSTDAGRTAIEMLLAQIESGPSSGTAQRLDTELIVRATTAVPPAA